MPTPTTPDTGAIGGDDLSALAWVQGELRRSLEHAHKALRRYVKESDSIRDSDVDAVDPSVLRTARVHILAGTDDDQLRVDVTDTLGSPVLRAEMTVIRS